MDNFPHLPTMLAVAAAIVALVFILNKWLFGPLNEILAARETEVEAARAAFEQALEVQDQRLAEIEAQLAGARKDAFSIREQAHAQAREQREATLTEARADAMQTVDAAKAEIATQINAAREQLDRDADELAAKIAERLLGRPVASDGGQS